MLSIAIKDYWGFIRKNKLLFMLITVGLFAISYLSFTVFDLSRQDLLKSLNQINKGKGSSLVFQYETPVSSKDVYDILDDYEMWNYSVCFVSEEANRYIPGQIILLLSPEKVLTTLSTKPISELAVIGRNRSVLTYSDFNMLSGRYLNKRDKYLNNAILSANLSYLTENDRYSVNGVDYNIVGTLDSSEEFNYSQCSLVVTCETFAANDIPLKNLIISFSILPTQEFVDTACERLNSLGVNENTAGNIQARDDTAYHVMVEVLLSYVATMLILMTMLILVFKCWIGTQQNIYVIYNICGIRYWKASALRFYQIIFFILPPFALAVGVYVLLNKLQYRYIIYSIIPENFVVNFVLIFIILCIISSVQSRGYTKYKVLSNL